MPAMLGIAALAGAILWSTGPALAGEPAPTGTLRAVFLAGNPVQGRVDATTGAVSGPAVDLARELARRHGVATTIEGVPGVRAVIDRVKAEAADIGFLAFDPERATEVDFSQVYSLAHNTYLVPDDSPIRSVADADRAGHRIGVGQGDAADLYLKRTLKNAQLVPNAGGAMDVALQMLAGGDIGAYAANRQRLAEAIAQIAGMRLLPDNFLAVQQAIVVPKGRAERLAIVNAFLDDARKSGLVRDAIARAKLHGVDVAPGR
ncbi:MAG: transporter substrate-binding domain-containing protein [Alphaproteobacteria bacterium]|nr:transporter substrate-binding domain-containing protein [Alphaproteobacteria bacterium]